MTIGYKRAVLECDRCQQTTKLPRPIFGASIDKIYEWARSLTGRSAQTTTAAQAVQPEAESGTSAYGTCSAGHLDTPSALPGASG